MKSVQTLVKAGFKHCENNAFKQAPKSLTPEVAAIFNELFDELKAIFPAWGQSGVDAGQIKKTWAKGFVDNGITTKAQVAHGMRKARQSSKPFLPSVGQFCQWCVPTPEEFGLPSVEQAFVEAIQKNRFIDTEQWNHEAVYVATRATGVWAFKNQDSHTVRQAFVRNYEIAVRRVMNGEDLTAELPVALPVKVSHPTSKGKALDHLASFRQRFNFRRGLVKSY